MSIKQGLLISDTYYLVADSLTGFPILLYFFELQAGRGLLMIMSLKRIRVDSRSRKVLKRVLHNLSARQKN